MPSLFSQTIDLLTKSGALVYHLIVLFALEAIIGMTMGQARRNGWTPALRRTTIAASVLLIGRVVLMIVALLGQLGVPPGIIVSSAITPPLERYIDLISLGFLAWACVPQLIDRAQLGLGLVLAGHMPHGRRDYLHNCLTSFDLSSRSWPFAICAWMTLLAPVVRSYSRGGFVPPLSPQRGLAVTSP